MPPLVSYFTHLALAMRTWRRTGRLLFLGESVPNRVGKGNDEAQQRLAEPVSSERRI
jgi:hypothetical protein